MEAYNIINNLLLIFEKFIMILVAIFNYALEYKFVVLITMFFITCWLYQYNFSSTSGSNMKNVDDWINNYPLKQNILSEKKYPVKLHNLYYRKINNIKKQKWLSKHKTNKKLFHKLNPVPKIMSIIDYKLTEIPPNIIEFVSQDNYKLNDNKLSALGSYLIAKGLFTKIFGSGTNTGPNARDTIRDFDSFTTLYKKYIQMNPVNTMGYNFCIKLYNKYNTMQRENAYDIYDMFENTEYLHLSNETIVKIKNTKPYEYIERRLGINNLFIMKKDNNIVLSYGSFITCDIEPELINKFFSNSTDYSQIKKYYKYNKMKIIYWTSVIT
jgi:hypothetical protein